MYTLFICLSVCLFESNKRQNGYTDWTQILCGTSHDPREGLWMIKIKKIYTQHNSIFSKFKKSTIFFYKIRELFSSALQCLQREIEIEKRIEVMC